MSNFSIETHNMLPLFAYSGDTESDDASEPDNPDSGTNDDPSEEKRSNILDTQTKFTYEGMVI